MYKKMWEKYPSKLQHTKLRQYKNPIKLTSHFSKYSCYWCRDFYSIYEPKSLFNKKKYFNTERFLFISNKYKVEKVTKRKNFDQIQKSNLTDECLLLKWTVRHTLHHFYTVAWKQRIFIDSKDKKSIPECICAIRVDCRRTIQR